MALEEFKYPSQWTESLESYHKHKNLIIEKIKNYMENYQNYLPLLDTQKEILSKEYFSATDLYNNLSA